MATPATFFIADRLRGIPLVTGGSREKSTYRDDVSASRLVHVEKRGIDDQPSTTQAADAGLLFRPAAMTASISNVVRSSRGSTSTTRRPQVRTTTTPKPRKATQASRKWKTTTTSTTTVRPRTAQAARKEVGGGKLAQLISRQVASDQQPIPISTLSMSRAQQPMTITEPIPTSSATSVEVSSETSTESPTRSMLAKMIDVGSQSTESVPQTSLTKSIQQSMSTPPLSQRRAPQLVNFPKYTNRPNEAARSAGENWVLFNRPDGNFSVFELAALISNVMIVSTIILVIIFGWIKAIKKRRASTRKAASEGQSSSQMSNQQPIPGASGDVMSKSPTNQVSDAASDRASKMSFISSAVSGSTLATATDSNQTNQLSQATSSGANTMQHSASVTNPTSEMSDKTLDQIRKVDEAVKSGALDMGKQVIGAAQNISSEIKGSGMNIANKAMAIVQPTENNMVASNADSSANSESDKPIKDLKEQLPARDVQQKLISRSVSDLSGGAKLKTKEGDQSMEPVDQVKRSGAAVLEDLFKGSAPNLTTSNEPTGVRGKSNDAQKPNLGHKMSTSSLDSIELPGELVETIKKSTLRNPDDIQAPSPNLLLGQSAGKQAGPEPTASTSAKPSDDTSKTADKSAGPRGNPKPADPKLATDAKRDSQNTKSNPKILRPDKKTPMTSDGNGKQVVESERPQNPMGRLAGDQRKSMAKPSTDDGMQVNDESSNHVKNHQVVVNKLDKRKTNLEIVDLRDESVTGKIKVDKDGNKTPTVEGEQSNWISMDGLAVVQPTSANQQQQSRPQSPNSGQQQLPPMMSPSEIMESRFKVDYGSKRRQANKNQQLANQQDSMDSKTEEYLLNNIENELELDNKMKNRKYFVYVVHDGHFAAKKECIARIELPPKRRITLAELRQLIASSQDISLSSLRKNRFKFVTETYRLLNENEDAAILHQVYPTQGVFLKLNVGEQENQSYPYRGGSRGRLSNSGPTSSSLAQATIASSRRATGRTGQPRVDGTLPAIEVKQSQAVSNYGRARAVSGGRRTGTATGGSTRGLAGPGGAYRRSKSSVQAGRRAVGGVRSQVDDYNSSSGSNDRLPSLGRSQVQRDVGSVRGRGASRQQRVSIETRETEKQHSTLGGAATDLGANVLSGAKRLLNTFL